MTNAFHWKGQAPLTLTARDRMPYKRPVDPPASSHISIEPSDTEEAQNRAFSIRQHFEFGQED